MLVFAYQVVCFFLKHLTAVFWPASVCFLKAVAIFVGPALPGTKKQVSLFLRKVNMGEEEDLGCFGKQKETPKIIL